MVETLLEQIAPDPESRDFLLESWSSRSMIDGALLGELAGAPGPLARTPVPGVAQGRVDRVDSPALSGVAGGGGLRTVMIRVVLENLVKRYDGSPSWTGPR